MFYNIKNNLRNKQQSSIFDYQFKNNKHYENKQQLQNPVIGSAV